MNISPEQDLMVKYFTSCKALKKLIKTEPITNFSWEIRRTFESIEAASTWEQKVLRRLKVVDDPRWFNQNAAGYIVPTAAGLRQISEFHKGKPKTAEHKAKIAAANKGKAFSPDHIENLRLSHIGINSGKDHPNWGKHLSKETKNKIGAANRGKPKNSPEFKERLRQNWLGANNPGRFPSDQTRKKMSEAHKGEKSYHFGSC